MRTMNAKPNKAGDITNLGIQTHKWALEKKNPIVGIKKEK